MIVIFVLIAGLVLKCTLSTDPLLTQCAISGFKDFGILASAGVLELIYEYKGIVSIFQSKEKKKDDED